MISSVNRHLYFCILQRPHPLAEDFPAGVVLHSVPAHAPCPVALRALRNSLVYNEASQTVECSHCGDMRHHPVCACLPAGIKPRVGCSEYLIHGIEEFLAKTFEGFLDL